MNLLMSNMAMLSFIFMWLKHPLTMALVIIMQTLMVSMSTGMMLGSFWFSYIVLIIMLSGMLVLFVYMASIASNEKFHPSIKMMLLSSLVFGITLYYTQNLEETDMEVTSDINLSMTLIKLFSSSTMLMTIIMVMYLFFSMVVVSYIVNISEGPLRIKK